MITLYVQLLIDWIVFYAVSGIFQAINSGACSIKKNIFTIREESVYSMFNILGSFGYLIYHWLISMKFKMS